jgi:hypothetical protein
LEKHYPTRLSINYLKETMMGETILLNRFSEDGSRFIMEGKSEETLPPKFRGHIIFD